MFIRSVLSAVSVLGVIVLVAPAGPAAATNKPGIVVLDVKGSGCRPETTAAALSEDRTALTILYSDYIAAATGSTGRAARSCKINLRIEPVPGAAPTITSSDYRGFAAAAEDSTVDMSASYGFHGAPHATSALRLTGPFDGRWQTTDVNDGGLVTGECGASSILDLDTTLSVTSQDAGASTDFAAMDSTDVVVPNEFHISWASCS